MPCAERRRTGESPKRGLHLRQQKVIDWKCHAWKIAAEWALRYPGDEMSVEPVVRGVTQTAHSGVSVQQSAARAVGAYTSALAQSSINTVAVVELRVKEGPMSR